MKKATKILALLLIIGIGISSCSKDKIQKTQNARQSTLNDFYKLTQAPLQSFTINAAQFQTVVGAKGTTIYLPPSAFKTKTGAIVSSGNVIVKLQEMLKGADMILSNKTTTSDGKLLKSGGQIYIKAYKDGEELVMNKSVFTNVYIPSATNTPMDLFYGTVTPSDSISGDTTINWTPVDTSRNVVNTTITDTTAGHYTYAFTFKLDSLTYINCDYFYNSPNPLTNIFVTTPSAFVDSNTNVFIYFPSINSVTRMHTFNFATNTFSLSNGYFVPEGLSIKIVVIAKIEDQYYYEIKPTTVVTNLTVTSNPVAATLAEIQTAIQGL
ncbi:MAG: hypothetical protein U0U67_10520 [Chitinophagales bacterium]